MCKCDGDEKPLWPAFFRSSSLRWYLQSSVQPSSVRRKPLSLTAPGYIYGAQSRFQLVSGVPVHCYVDLISNIAFLAIIVACLASFRNLFSAQPQTKRYEPPSGPSGSNKWLQGSKPRSKLRQFIDTLASSSDQTHSTYQVQIENRKYSTSTSETRSDSRDEIPLQKATHVHVRSDVDLVHEPAQA